MFGDVEEKHGYRLLIKTNGWPEISLQDIHDYVCWEYPPCKRVKQNLYLYLHADTLLEKGKETDFLHNAAPRNSAIVQKHRDSWNGRTES